MFHSVDFGVVDTRLGFKLVARGFGIDPNWSFVEILTPIFGRRFFLGIRGHINDSMVFAFHARLQCPLATICQNRPGS